MARRVVLVIAALAAASVMPGVAALGDAVSARFVTLDDLGRASGRPGDDLTVHGQAGCPALSSMWPLGESTALAAPAAAPVQVVATYTADGTTNLTHSWGGPVDGSLDGNTATWSADVTIPDTAEPGTTVQYVAWLTCASDEAVSSGPRHILVEGIEEPTASPTGTGTGSPTADSSPTPESTRTRESTATPGGSPTPGATAAPTHRPGSLTAPHGTPAEPTARPGPRDPASPGAPRAEARPAPTRSPTASPTTSSTASPTQLPYTGADGASWSAAAGLAALTLGAGLVLAASESRR